jgi:hypothetical protein
MSRPATRTRTRRPWRFAALVVVPLALLVAACGGGGDSSSSGGSSGSDGPACPVDALADAKGPVDITV